MSVVAEDVHCTAGEKMMVSSFLLVNCVVFFCFWLLIFLMDEEWMLFWIFFTSDIWIMSVVGKNALAVFPEKKCVVGKSMQFLLVLVIGE